MLHRRLPRIYPQTLGFPAERYFAGRGSVPPRPFYSYDQEETERRQREMEQSVLRQKSEEDYKRSVNPIIVGKETMESQAQPLFTMEHITLFVYFIYFIMIAIATYQLMSISARMASLEMMLGVKT